MSACAIEDVVSCRGRMRILGILIEAKELNITAISKRASLNHSATMSHLKVLKSVGLINEKTFGRIRIFSFNFKDERAMIFADLFNRFASQTPEDRDLNESTRIVGPDSRAKARA